MLSVNNLVKIYPNDTRALDDVSFKIEEGEICGYLGPNGAGKTTTIKILSAMISPTSGSVVINGYNVFEYPNKVKKIIGYVPESGALFLSLTPYDFLEFVCKMYDMDKRIYNKRIFNFMELFDLKNEIRTPMHAFSKGMRQKVLIISSLIHDPDIILWDEPLSGIDYNTTNVIRNIVKELSSAGKIFFYSTHVVESVDKICTRILVLNSGRIAFDGEIDNLNGRTVEEIMKKYADSGDMHEKISGLYKNISSS
ncbi:MAG: ABC transporter ATP-binding protein [Chlorobi bacterium]|nr:ABC transporter ATP-binding protein [Chlorobiota bacterium]MCI0716026.1 ABC transporter ATP-binding protein [Chlorobiota bacterium]